MDVLDFEPHHEVADIKLDIDQQQVGALAAAQYAQGLFGVFGMSHRRAVFHCDLGRGGQLALQAADDEKPHDLLLSVDPACCPDRRCLESRKRQPRSAAMISVMVTPNLSSTSTTSPRATSRLLI